MPRSDFTSAITNGIAEKDARPIWLVKMGFPTPMRICSRGDFTYSGAGYLGVGGFAVAFEGDWLSGSLQWFNEDFTYSTTFITHGTAGITCEVWMAYMEAADTSTTAIADADFTKMFDGELGPARLRNRQVSVDLVQAEQVWSPRQVIRAPVCNHIPPDGTEVRTPNGIIVLKRTQ